MKTFTILEVKVWFYEKCKNNKNVREKNNSLKVLLLCEVKDCIPLPPPPLPISLRYKRNIRKSLKEPNMEPKDPQTA